MSTADVAGETSKLFKKFSTQRSRQQFFKGSTDFTNSGCESSKCKIIRFVVNGGVDYQMIKTKRGKDMLLYEGYTFTQNRMCKDGMRWQCSYARCKAYCRMSSAGWLTPYKTYHDHPKPSDQEIKKRILRMELKARAQSSGATPNEIIRNALPAEEYQTTDQKACYTRCIQRYRKSLQKKSLKPPDEWPPPDVAQPVKTVLKVGEECSWMTKPMESLPDSMKSDKLWQTSEPGNMIEKQEQFGEKDILEEKIGPFGM